MNFWWVNQNQTFRQETSGKYMWSPKFGKSGKRVPYYDFMKEVAPGDGVFSFSDTYISFFGLAKSHCFEAPQPRDFGSIGHQWDKSGWKVHVDFSRVKIPFRPVDHIALLAPHLPPKYSPIRADGNGNQCYLTKIPSEMAHVLLNLGGLDAKMVGKHSTQVIQNLQPDNEALIFRIEHESEIESSLRTDAGLSETEKKSLIDSRRGQGKFRAAVAKIEPRCRLTGVTNLEHRIASHIKPWRHSSNAERLDGENGLLLAPHIDHLFDGGFISFANDGNLLISPASDRFALSQLGISDKPVNVGSFTKRQKFYLEFHRTQVFKSSSY